MMKMSANEDDKTPSSFNNYILLETFTPIFGVDVLYVVCRVHIVLQSALLAAFVDDDFDS